MTELKAFLKSVETTNMSDSSGFRCTRDSQSLFRALDKRPHAATPPICREIWRLLLAVSTSTNVTLHWVTGHCGLRRNDEADLAATRRLPQDDVPIKIPSAKAALRRAVIARADAVYTADVHCATHRDDLGTAARPRS